MAVAIYCSNSVEPHVANTMILAQLHDAHMHKGMSIIISVEVSAFPRPVDVIGHVPLHRNHLSL